MTDDADGRSVVLRFTIYGDDPEPGALTGELQCDVLLPPTIIDACVDLFADSITQYIVSMLKGPPPDADVTVIDGVMRIR